MHAAYDVSFVHDIMKSSVRFLLSVRTGRGSEDRDRVDIPEGLGGAARARLRSEPSRGARHFSSSSLLSYVEFRGRGIVDVSSLMAGSAGIPVAPPAGLPLPGLVRVEEQAARPPLHPHQPT